MVNNMDAPHDAYGIEYDLHQLSEAIEALKSKGVNNETILGEVGRILWGDMVRSALKDVKVKLNAH